MTGAGQPGVRGPWTYDLVCVGRGLVLAVGVGIAALVWLEPDSWVKGAAALALLLAIFVNSAWATADVLRALASAWRSRARGSADPRRAPQHLAAASLRAAAGGLPFAALWFVSHFDVSARAWLARHERELATAVETGQSPPGETWRVDRYGTRTYVAPGEEACSLYGQWVHDASVAESHLSGPELSYTLPGVGEEPRRFHHVRGPWFMEHFLSDW